MIIQGTFGGKPIRIDSKYIEAIQPGSKKGEIKFFMGGQSAILADSVVVDAKDKEWTKADFDWAMNNPIDVSRETQVTADGIVYPH